MLGSGDEPDPKVIFMVEHRDKILYYKSTTHHNKGGISMLNQDYTLISPKILLYSFKGDWIQGETEHNISLRFGRGIQQAAVVFMMS